MSILSVRQAIVDTFDVQIPSLKTCDTHGGRFNLDELKRFGAQSPTVLVAALTTTNIEREGDKVEGDQTFVAYCIARPSANAKQDENVLAIVEAVQSLVPDNHWGSDDVVSIATNIRSDNLYSTAIDKYGVDLWAVTWQQRIVLAEDNTFDALNDFITYAADHVAADPDAPISQDEVTLEQTT